MLRDIIPLKKPFTLVVEPSGLCNFRCIMCFQSASESRYFNKNRHNMPFETFQLIVDQMSQWGEDKLKVLKLSLYGEPLINPDFCKMLALARDADIAERIETTSNVSLLTPAISEGLVKGGLDYIRVSVYSPLQEKHEKITASPISIDTIRGNLEVLQEIKIRYNSEKPFVAVKMLDTYSEENEVFREMYRDVADEIYIEKPHNWVASTEKSFINSLYGEQNDSVISDLNDQDNKLKACGVSFYTLSVRNNGDVAPCCVDWSGGTNVGNIADMSLRDIWLGEQMRQFWIMQLQGRNAENKSCRNCRVYKSNYYSKDDVDGVSIERLYK